MFNKTKDIKKEKISFKSGMFALGEGINAFSRGLGSKKRLPTDIKNKIKKGVREKAKEQYTNTWRGF